MCWRNASSRSERLACGRRPKGYLPRGIDRRGRVRWEFRRIPNGVNSAGDLDRHAAPLPRPRPLLDRILEDGPSRQRNRDPVNQERREQGQHE